MEALRYFYFDSKFPSENHKLKEVELRGKPHLFRVTIVQNKCRF